jgi:uncharacterized protein (DUF2062 family)
LAQVLSLSVDFFWPCSPHTPDRQLSGWALTTTQTTCSLSVGAIVGIVVGACVGGAVVIVGVVLLTRYCVKTKDEQLNRELRAEELKGLSEK